MSEKMIQQLMTEPKKITFREVDIPKPGPDQVLVKIKRIGVLTSGGDAPGMNAAVRAVARTALAYGIECIGIRRGWQGLITGDFVKRTADHPVLDYAVGDGDSVQ